MDGSSKDKVLEYIEEDEAVLVDNGDGEDNEGGDNGLVDVGEQIGVCGGRGRGCGGNRRGRNNNNINMEQWKWTERGTVENNDTDILVTGVEKLNIYIGNNLSPLNFFGLYFTQEVVELLATETN